MTKYTNLSIGDAVPRSARQSVFAEPLDDPEWFIFRTAPKQEFNAALWLERRGASDAWFPTETRWRNVPRAKIKRREYEAPVAPGYLFVRVTHRPVWHAVFDQANGKLSRVVARDGVPLPITEKVIARMKHVPARIAAIRAREEQNRRVAPGDRADVTDGPLEGWTVDVSRIHGGIAYFIAPLLGEREISVRVDALRKIGV